MCPPGLTSARAHKWTQDGMPSKINVPGLLVSIELRLEGPMFAKAHVRGLIICHFCQIGIEMTQMKAGRILVHPFRQ